MQWNKKRNKYGTVWNCITVPFFHMELRNSFVFAPLFRFCITVPFLYHCSVFSQGTTVQKRNSVVLYHCAVFFTRNKNGTVWYCFTVPFFFAYGNTEQFRFCTTVPFLHYRSVFFSQGTKTEQCGIVSLFRFFFIRNNGTKTEKLVFYHCSVFFLWNYGTVSFLHHCSVFALLFCFFFHRNNGTKTEQCGILSLFRFFIRNNGTKTEQCVIESLFRFYMELRNSFVLHRCSVFALLFRF